MGGYPPLFVLGGFRSQKLSKKNVFLEKTLLGNVVNSSVFACFTFFCRYLRCFMHVFSKNAVNTSVFEEVVQKHCKIHYFGHVVLPKCRK